MTAWKCLGVATDKDFYEKIRFICLRHRKVESTMAIYNKNSNMTHIHTCKKIKRKKHKFIDWINTFLKLLENFRILHGIKAVLCTGIIVGAFFK